MAEDLNERWLPVEGFPDYMVSDKGRVKSYRNPQNPKMLKQATNHNGYKCVILMSGNGYGAPGAQRKSKQVHRLVAQAFIPNPENKPQVDHIIPISVGGTSEASNLRWVTAKENYYNVITQKNMEDARPEAVKKTMHQVYVYDEDLNLIATYPSTAEAARLTKKNQGNIASCCTGALPRYNGYIWSYVKLNNIEERKKLEEEKRYQFIKNRKSTYRAVSRYQKAQYAAGRGWYHRHTEECRKKYLEYYYAHREEILAKSKAKRDEEKRRREERGN